MNGGTCITFVLHFLILYITYKLYSKVHSTKCAANTVSVLNVWIMEATCRFAHVRVDSLLSHAHSKTLIDDLIDYSCSKLIWELSYSLNTSPSSSSTLSPPFHTIICPHGSLFKTTQWDFPINHLWHVVNYSTKLNWHEEVAAWIRVVLLTGVKFSCLKMFRDGWSFT